MEKVPFISFKSVNKSYEKNIKVLDKLSFEIEEGSFVTILGASGSGKTSVLNLLSGFIKPENGKILLNGIDIKDVSPNERPTATVFQDYALFPHMNVFQNISFGLKKMYIDLKTINKKKLLKIETLKNKSIKLSVSKIKKINKKINKNLNIFFKYKQKWISSKNRIFFFYLKWIKKKIIDLDYWKSHWEYYPIVKNKKINQKYAQRPLNKNEIKKKVFEIIDLLDLKGKEWSLPSTLSGGSKQKVALARAIVTQPSILLLDEPLSAIDKNIREKMQIELKRLHKKLKITFVLITHDQKEALFLSDQILVLKSGKIEQQGTPSQIYDSPINPWVANFMGKANLFIAIYKSPGKVNFKEKVFKTHIKKGFENGEKVIAMIRPEDYDVVSPSKGLITVTVIDVIYKGQLWELKCKFYETTLYVENFNEVVAGSVIGLIWDSVDLHIMKYF